MSARGRFLLPTDFDDLKVRLCNSKGEYLVKDPTGWTFSNDRQNAFVFDYIGDRIEEYLESIARFRGIVLRATPIDPKELMEVCDQCLMVMTQAEAFFDGKIFLCPRCRSKLSTRRSIP